MFFGITTVIKTIIEVEFDVIWNLYVEPLLYSVLHLCMVRK